jgi:DNA-binding GntR family transcriptional regulator
MNPTSTTDDPVTRSLPEGGHVEAVYRQLRDAILRGEMAPGLEIRQEELARDLAVSRTPLREALRKLEYEGLVELFMARIPLEVIAMRMTIPKLDTRDIAALEGDMAQMAHYARAEDWTLWNTPHRAFHARLVSHAGSRTGALLARLIDHAARYWGHYMVHQPLRLTWGVDAHRAILDACIEGDVDGAVRLQVDHLYDMATTLMSAVDPDYVAEGLRVAATIAKVPVPPGPDPSG